MTPPKPQYQALGASGLKVSKLWLGAMMFGDQTDEAEAANIVAASIDAGLNAIDTANVGQITEADLYAALQRMPPAARRHI